MSDKGHNPTVQLTLSDVKSKQLLNEKSIKVTTEKHQLNLP